MLVHVQKPAELDKKSRKGPVQKKTMRQEKLSRHRFRIVRQSLSIAHQNEHCIVTSKYAKHHGRLGQDAKDAVMVKLKRKIEKLTFIDIYKLL